MWLGSADDALDLDALLARGITAVLNMAHGSCVQDQRTIAELGGQLIAMAGPKMRYWATAEFTEEWYRNNTGCGDFQYLALDAEDREDYPISQLLDEAVSFLQRCRTEGRPTLVHCVAGVNRSACACAAFLTRQGLGESERAMTARAAIDFVRQRRQGTLQNIGFLQQLAAYAPSSPELQDQPASLTEPTARDGATFISFQLGPVLERSRGLGEAAAQEPPKRTSKFRAARGGGGGAATAAAAATAAEA